MEMEVTSFEYPPSEQNINEKCWECILLLSGKPILVSYALDDGVVPIYNAPVFIGYDVCVSENLSLTNENPEEAHSKLNGLRVLGYEILEFDRRCFNEVEKLVKTEQIFVFLLSDFSKLIFTAELGIGRSEPSVHYFFQFGLENKFIGERSGTLFHCLSGVIKGKISKFLFEKK